MECCYHHPAPPGRDSPLACGPEDLSLPYDPEFCYYRTPCPHMIRPPLFVAHGFTDSCEWLSLQGVAGGNGGASSITAAYTKILNGLSDTVGSHAMCLSLSWDSSLDITSYIEWSIFDYVSDWSNILVQFTWETLGLTSSGLVDSPSCFMQSVWPVNMVGFSQGGLVIRGYMQTRQ